MTKTEIKNRLRNLEHLKGFEVQYKTATNTGAASINSRETSASSVNS